jgi:hypothetical protein
MHVLVCANKLTVGAGNCARGCGSMLCQHVPHLAPALYTSFVWHGCGCLALWILLQLGKLPGCGWAGLFGLHAATGVHVAASGRIRHWEVLDLTLGDYILACTSGVAVLQPHCFSCSRIHK